MIEKPISRLVQTLEARSFTVIGCPGADGIGVEASYYFGSALAGAEGDFVVVLGDVAPAGRDPFYRDAAAFIDAASGEKPVYVVPGVRDGAMFETYYGHRDQAVISEEFVLIMLDNSSGSFSPESLSFFRDTLAIADAPNTVVAFALPPPNRFSGRSMSPEAWARFEEAAGVWRKRISLLLAGTVPAYFEDEVDDIRLVVTGGGGAVVRNPGRVMPTRPHVAEVRFDAGVVVAPALLRRDARPGHGDDLRVRLERRFEIESRAHVALLVNAEEAERRGRPNLARLFRAASQSRLRLACNLRRVWIAGESPEESVDLLLRRLEGEESERYGNLAAADAEGNVQAAHVFKDLLSGEFVHLGLFEQARKELEGGGDIAASGYFVCSSCGIIFSGYAPPDNCPECGARSEFIHETL